MPKTDEIASTVVAFQLNKFGKFESPLVDCNVDVAFVVVELVVDVDVDVVVVGRVLPAVCGLLLRFMFLD